MIGFSAQFNGALSEEIARITKNRNTILDDQ